MTKYAGLLCERDNIPEDCEWEEAQETHQFFYNYLLLDTDGFLPTREKHFSWRVVDFELFKHAYALYKMGINPVEALNYK